MADAHEKSDKKGGKEKAKDKGYVKTCLYEVLGVERNVEQDLLKKAYRKSVLVARRCRRKQDCSRIPCSLVALSVCPA